MPSRRVYVLIEITTCTWVDTAILKTFVRIESSNSLTLFACKTQRFISLYLLLLYFYCVSRYSLVYTMVVCIVIIIIIVILNVVMK
jgi:hypothetical protein